MSGQQERRPDAVGAGAAGNGADPSMEDILASIRRILSEDETPPTSPEKDVLVLDRSMEVPPEPGAEAMHRPEEMDAAPLAAPSEAPARAPGAEMSQMTDPGLARAAEPAPAPTHERGGLVAPETETAAASAMGGLMRRLSLERGAAVYRGGPTVEDLVREEMRPLLKSWLDSNLPNLVEQLVREEIERVVKRASL